MFLKPRSLQGFNKWVHELIRYHTVIPMCMLLKFNQNIEIWAMAFHHPVVYGIHGCHLRRMDLLICAILGILRSLKYRWRPNEARPKKGGRIWPRQGWKSVCFFLVRIAWAFFPQKIWGCCLLMRLFLHEKGRKHSGTALHERWNLYN